MLLALYLTDIYYVQVVAVSKKSFSAIERLGRWQTRQEKYGELETEELFVLHRPEERVSQGDFLYIPIKDEIQTTSYIAKCVL